MSHPIFVRDLTPAERDALRAGLRSASAFTLRRCQYLLASADRLVPVAIARTYGGTAQQVRNVLRDFADRSLACLRKGSNAAKVPRRVWPLERDGDLQALLHHSPRESGKETSLWTLDLLAEVCFESGWTERLLTGEAIRQTLRRLEVNWKRAKNWLVSPDPEYAAKKKERDRLIRLADLKSHWVLGFLDEVWWTRLAQPAVNAWTADGEPLRLFENPKGGGKEALACYGIYRHDTGGMMLRFVEGRPISAATEEFLAWAAGVVRGRRQEGVRGGLGQRLVARQRARARVGGGAQPNGAAGGPGVPDPAAGPAGEGPVAQPDRAEVDARQAEPRRTRAKAHRRGTQGTGPQILRL